MGNRLFVESRLAHLAKRLSYELQQIPDKINTQFNLATINYYKTVQLIVLELDNIRSDLGAYQRGDDITGIKMILRAMNSVKYNQMIQVIKQDGSIVEKRLDTMLSEVSPLATRFINKRHDSINVTKLQRFIAKDLNLDELIDGISRSGNNLAYIIPQLSVKFGHNNALTMLLDIIQCHVEVQNIDGGSEKDVSSTYRQYRGIEDSESAKFAYNRRERESNISIDISDFIGFAIIVVLLVILIYSFCKSPESFTVLIKKGIDKIN